MTIHRHAVVLALLLTLVVAPGVAAKDDKKLRKGADRRIPGQYLVLLNMPSTFDA